MFTGIVRNFLQIEKIKKSADLLSYCILLPTEGLEEGASVAINGVCQTVVRIDQEGVWFQAIDETLKRTTFKTMQEGEWVNIERSARLGDEIGGHLLSGHIYGTALIQNITNNIYTFSLKPEWTKFLFEKGYVSIDGVSLTVVSVTETRGLFTVHLIPETLKRTTLGIKKERAEVNIEFDAITQAAVETVERFLARKLRS